jgi:hypothetical protein
VSPPRIDRRERWRGRHHKAAGRAADGGNGRARPAGKGNVVLTGNAPCLQSDCEERAIRRIQNAAPETISACRQDAARCVWCSGRCSGASRPRRGRASTETRLRLCTSMSLQGLRRGLPRRASNVLRSASARLIETRSLHGGLLRTCATHIRVAQREDCPECARARNCNHHDSSWSSG